MDSRRPLRSLWKVTHHVSEQDPSRHHASGPSSISPAPAMEALLDLLDMAMVLDLLGMGALAFVLTAVGPASTAQVTFLPRVSSHLITSQALTLAFAGQLSKHPGCILMVSAPYRFQMAPPTSRID
ncbi:hypothetical protein HispidOSU_008713 [Sigmodon hispidus]